MIRTRLLLAFVSVMAQCGTARAADGQIVSPDQILAVSAGIGALGIDVRNSFYMGDHQYIRMDWQSRGTALLSLDGVAKLDADYLIKANLEAGLAGDGFLRAVSWQNFGQNGPDDWTDRSLHPDTQLDHYLAGSIELDKRIWADDDNALNIGVGVKYTDVQWTAAGGSFVFSQSTFRDTIGNLPDGQRFFSYRMKMPAVYASIAASHTVENWTFSGGLKAGAGFGLENIGHYWVGSTRSTEHMNAAPMVGADLKASYAMSDNLSLYLGGSFEKLFETKGTSVLLDTATGTSGRSILTPETSYQSVSLTFGLKRQF